MRILLLDDDWELAELMMSALQKRGHSVDCARTLTGARFYLSANGAYDLTVLDYDLGNGEIGPDLIPELEGAPVVLFSGLTRDGYDIPQFRKSDLPELIDFIENLEVEDVSQV